MHPLGRAPKAADVRGRGSLMGACMHTQGVAYWGAPRWPRGGGVGVGLQTRGGGQLSGMQPCTRSLLVLELGADARCLRSACTRLPPSPPGVHLVRERDLDLGAGYDCRAVQPELPYDRRGSVCQQLPKGWLPTGAGLCFEEPRVAREVVLGGHVQDAADVVVLFWAHCVLVSEPRMHPKAGNDLQAHATGSSRVVRCAIDG